MFWGRRLIAAPIVPTDNRSDPNLGDGPDYGMLHKFSAVSHLYSRHTEDSVSVTAERHPDDKHIVIH